MGSEELRLKIFMDLEGFTDRLCDGVRVLGEGEGDGCGGLVFRPPFAGNLRRT